MKCHYHIIFIFILNLSLLLSGIPVVNSQTAAGDHLEKYAKYSAPFHESIDDSSEDHGHTHKHSEDGETHEHHHNHSNISHYENFKINPFYILTIDSEHNGELKQVFYKKNLISSAHPQEVFRPPIV